LWTELIDSYNIKTVLDVGCGRGFASRFFKSMDCEILGIDGSEKVKDVSLIPENFVLNDYEKGSAILDDRKFDLGWSCEFVEHVYEQYIPNFMSDFKKCKFLAMTFAYKGQGGWHHVNENTQEYWVDVLEKNGFEFREEETRVLREKAKLIQNTLSHFGERGLFFVNNSW
jgi:SAM-dependent methyltransferase